MDNLRLNPSCREFSSVELEFQADQQNKRIPEMWTQGLKSSNPSFEDD